MLEQCADLFEQMGKQRLATSLRANIEGKDPLVTPGGFKPRREVQMYQLHWSAADRKEGLAVIVAAVEQRRSTSATAQRGLGGFVQAWQEFAQYQAESPE